MCSSDLYKNGLKQRHFNPKILMEEFDIKRESIYLSNFQFYFLSFTCDDSQYTKVMYFLEKIIDIVEEEE